MRCEDGQTHHIVSDRRDVELGVAGPMHLDDVGPRPHAVVAPKAVASPHKAGARSVAGPLKL